MKKVIIGVLATVVLGLLVVGQVIIFDSTPIFTADTTKTTYNTTDTSIIVEYRLKHTYEYTLSELLHIKQKLEKDTAMLILEKNNMIKEYNVRVRETVIELRRTEQAINKIIEP